MSPLRGPQIGQPSPTKKLLQIRIDPATHPLLRRVAQTGDEAIGVVIDRLVTDEARRLGLLERS